MRSPSPTIDQTQPQELRLTSCSHWLAMLARLAISITCTAESTWQPVMASFCECVKPTAVYDEPLLGLQSPLDSALDAVQAGCPGQLLESFQRRLSPRRRAQINCICPTRPSSPAELNHSQRLVTDVES